MPLSVAAVAALRPASSAAVPLATSRSCTQVAPSCRSALTLSSSVRSSVPSGAGQTQACSRPCSGIAGPVVRRLRAGRALPRRTRDLSPRRAASPATSPELDKADAERKLDESGLSDAHTGDPAKSSADRGDPCATDLRQDGDLRDRSPEDEHRVDRLLSLTRSCGPQRNRRRGPDSAENAALASVADAARTAVKEAAAAAGFGHDTRCLSTASTATRTPPSLRSTCEMPASPRTASPAGLSREAETSTPQSSKSMSCVPAATRAMERRPAIKSAQVPPSATLFATVPTRCAQSVTYQTGDPMNSNLSSPASLRTGPPASPDGVRALTPLNAQPFEAISLIARQAHEALLDRLGPAG